MDGDSSTTDTSQLGITGEYMASGHYVLQSQDGKRRQKEEGFVTFFPWSSCFVVFFSSLVVISFERLDLLD